MFPLGRGRVEGALGRGDEGPMLVGGEVRHERPVRKGAQAGDDVEARSPRFHHDRVRTVGHVPARPGYGAARIVSADQRDCTLRDRDGVHRRAVGHVQRALQLHDRRDGHVVAPRRAERGAKRAHGSVEHPGRDE